MSIVPAIPRVANPAEAKVGMFVRGLLKSHNAKPFLTGPHCHSFIRGPGYLEADIDVHRFCFAARKATYSFLESLKTMIIDIGFVVEGKDDSELPEQVLGCTKVSYWDPVSGRNFKQYLSQLQQEREQRAKKLK